MFDHLQELLSEMEQSVGIDAYEQASDQLDQLHGQLAQCTDPGALRLLQPRLRKLLATLATHQQERRTRLLARSESRARVHGYQSVAQQSL